MTGFLWKADPDKQKAFVKKYERQKAQRPPPGGGAHQAVFRGRLPPGLGAGPGLFLLAAGGAAVPGGHGQRPEAAEHPGGVLPRRPGVPGPAADPGQHQRRAVRQPAAAAAGAAPGDQAVHPVPGQRRLLRQAGGQGVVEASPGVPPGAGAAVLAEREPDRAAVEVPEAEGVEPVAPDVRGDAGRRCRRCWITWTNTGTSWRR